MFFCWEKRNCLMKQPSPFEGVKKTEEEKVSHQDTKLNPEHKGLLLCDFPYLGVLVRNSCFFTASLGEGEPMEEIAIPY